MNTRPKEYMRLRDEKDALAERVQELTNALREEVRKRFYSKDGSQANDEFIDAKIVEMYPALAPAVEEQGGSAINASVYGGSPQRKDDA